MRSKVETSTVLKTVLVSSTYGQRVFPRMEVRAMLELRKRLTKVIDRTKKAKDWPT